MLVFLSLFSDVRNYNYQLSVRFSKFHIDNDLRGAGTVFLAVFGFVVSLLSYGGLFLLGVFLVFWARRGGCFLLPRHLFRLLDFNFDWASPSGYCLV